MSMFVPDLYFDTIYDVTPNLLQMRGIRFLLLDIDNTLVTYADAVPTESVCNWLKAMYDSGVKCAFVSNNSSDRADMFAENTPCEAFANAHKPFVSSAEKAMKSLGATEADTAVIGDQIFTDILMGKRLGVFTVLVKPIDDKRDFFTRFKRVLEKPFLRLYSKRNH